MPSRPSATARSATASTSSSPRSGAIFTSSGTCAVGDVVGAAADGAQQRLEPVDGLQVAQARCVRRGDVDDEVVGVRREQGGALLVVADGVLLGDHLGLADVDAERHAGAATGAVEPPRGQPAGHHLGAVVVEAHPVDDRAVGRQPGQPRLRVAGLRLTGDGADLDEPEAHVGQRVDADGVLVEARRETEQAREVAAPSPASSGPALDPADRVRRRSRVTGCAARIARKAAWCAFSGSVRVSTLSKSRW